MIKAKELLILNESFSTEEDYRASKLISYSTIKDINNDPNILLGDKENFRSKYLDLGSVVDILLTDCQNLQNKVFVINSVLPSENIQKIVKLIIVELKKDIKDITVDDAIYLFDQIDSNTRWLPNTKIKKIIEEGSEYYKAIKDAKGKIIICNSLLQEAKILAIRTKTNPWIRQYFQKKNIINQYKIEIKCGNINVKSMLDIIYIDDKHKTITPIDIKTGSLHPKAFLVNFYKYKYYYQGALYRKVLTNFIRSNVKELAEYSINPFKFIFISTINFLYPTIWNITDAKHYSILEGYKDVYGNSIKGIDELIEDTAVYYKQIAKSPHDLLMPIDLQKSSGEIDIDI